VAQIEVDKGHEIAPALQMDTDPNHPMETLPGVEADRHRSSKSADRTRHVTEQQWEAGQGTRKDGDDEDGNDQVGCDEDEDEDKDEDDTPMDKLLDISTWDLLAEGFECKAASQGMYSFYYHLHVPN
jgi:hypothetical protein